MSATHWWQTASIYEIYPRSFQDSLGDGIGDLRGAIRRLPYLVDLGIDAVWLTPVYRSPMKDFGYDISDYTDIDPIFGTMSDFDALLEEAHALGLKLIMDLVPNHTSDQHRWFLESRSSRENDKRDWYIWHDPASDGGPPNNWLSEFGGSAWEFDGATGQYYYHAFLASQPDLNWRNKAVRTAMYDVMRFWLKKGVDGFRVDVIWHLMKDAKFRNNPPNPAYVPGDPPHQKVLPLYTVDLMETFDVVSEMRAVIDEFSERLLIGEVYLPIEKLVRYYGPTLNGTHFPFNFTLLDAEWQAGKIAALINSYEAALPKGGWPNWVLGNHDRPRIAGRVGAQQARVAAMLLLTLRGTPTLYYGDEIGLPQVVIPPDRVRDPFEKNVPGIGVGRDGARTPMQWSTEPYAGFSTGEPWLPLAGDWRTDNIESLCRDSSSVLNLYRRLLRTRRERKALSLGVCGSAVAQGDVLLYRREWDLERLLVALNMGATAATVSIAGPQGVGRVILSDFGNRDGEFLRGAVNLAPNEGLVIELEPGVSFPDEKIS
jgi:alpha-glucosidase